MIGITIHRGADAIGGSCIEIAADSGRLILDLGMPLMANGGGEPDAGAIARPSVANGILPDVPGLFDDRGGTPVHGVVLSHAHPDHFGLLDHVREGVPVFMSRESLAMIETGNIFYPANMRLPGTAGRCHTFRHHEPFTLGDFTVTPLLVDHSAFGASALLVEVGGKRIFYSGDIRLHGRKEKATRAQLARIGRVDCMVMEGTTLGGRHRTDYASEQAVEEGLLHAFSKNNATFVHAAGSNIDRTVSLYRACKRRGKTLVIDPYQYTLLTRLRAFAPGLPPHADDHVRVFPESGQMARLEKAGMRHVVAEVEARKIEATEIIRRAPRMVLRFSWPVMGAIANQMPREGLSFIYSMWQGYLERNPRLRDFPQRHGGEWQIVHTSGHAWREDLQWMARKIRPAMLIPVHTLHGDDFSRYFDNVCRIKDGEEVVL